jgi:intracellular multiplication protein IcmB
VGKLFDGAVTFIGDVARFVSNNITKQTLDAYSRLHSVDSDFAFMADNGALVSVIHLRGVNTVIGDAEYEHVHSTLASVLAPYTREFGHLLQWTHFDDPSLFSADLARVTKPYEAAALSHSLDFGDIFHERNARIARFCSSEWTYITVWTYADVLSDHERRRVARERAAQIKKGARGQQFSSSVTQDQHGAAQPLRERHHSFVMKLLKDLTQARKASGAGYITRLLNVHEAAALIKSTSDAVLLKGDLRLVTNHDGITARAVKSPRDDRGVLAPLVREQLFTSSASEESVDIARIGNLFFASVSVQIGPMERVAFDRLVSACKGASTGMPWRVTINVAGGGMGRIVFRNVAARMFGASSANRPTLNAINELERRAREGLPNVSFQVTASTWGSNLEEARSRGASLSRAIQSWGVCTPSDFSGDAFEDAMSSVGAVRDAMPANHTVLPLEEAVRTLPMRAVSPWEHGAMLFRTADGRLMPVQPGQQIQQVAIEFAVAPMGYGKSVLLNARHFAALLSPRAKSLPFISVLDVGPSSRGLMELVSSRLPAHMQHLAVYAKIRNDANDISCRINPFDLHLGFRKPLARDRDTVVNILTGLMTPAGGQIASEGVELASTVTDYLYRRTGDPSSKAAKVYEPSVSSAIATAIANSNIVLQPRATWYEVVDALFERGLFRDAAIAQRYAVPVIQDAVVALNSDEILSIYGGKKDLIGQANRMLLAAINDYPMLSQPTTFDISTSRLVALDLDEVARGTGDAGIKLAGIAYNLCFTIATRRFNLRADDLLPDCVPQRYHGYWRSQIDEMLSAPMQLTFDEMHRTSGLPQVVKQVIIECREGRKRGINVMFASQSSDDLPDVIASELVNGIYLLGGPPAAVKKCAEKFGLNETQQIALSRYCLGPNSDGSTMLAIHETNMGRSAQLVTLTLGPIELWAYSTTPEDCALRAKVMDLLGTRHALLALASAFSSGSAKDVIEARERKLRGNSSLSSVDVIGKVAEEVVASYRAVAHSA